MKYKKLSITNVPAISAIYYSILQCGYDFYSIERDTLTAEKLHSFIEPVRGRHDFFFGVKQNTCEVYPYWPRAAMLETATFYIDLSQEYYFDFYAYKNHIMSSKNISDKERNQLFWDWIDKFPEALKQVLQSDGFGCYLKWENDWIIEQNQKYEKELRKIGNILALCKDKFNVPVLNIQIVLNPIKCVYSADYHLKDNNFIFCSGSLREEAIVHEFIHQIVHPIVEKQKGEILCRSFINLGIDASYYLNNDELGTLNAFEEYMVRILTDLIISGDIPTDLEMYFYQEINKFKRAPLS